MVEPIDPLERGEFHRSGVERAQLAQILDLIFEDDRLNVYAGKLEVRPPGAPTTRAGEGWGVWGDFCG